MQSPTRERAITGVFNDGYIAELYETFRRDPSSVEESWRQFFRFAERLGGATPVSGGTAAADPGLLRKVAAASALVEAIRAYGHLAVALDPLGTPPSPAPQLTLEFHGVTEAELQQIPGDALGIACETAAEGIRKLRGVYSSNLAIEMEHLGDEEERVWFRKRLEGGDLPRTLTPDEKKAILRRLTEVDGLERYLGRAFVGTKRFSIEGSDALVPVLDVAIDRAAEAGAREVAIAMAHRGRINVLAHILGKPYATVLEEFEGKHATTNAESETGDVKYHLGFRGERTTASGRHVDLILVPNPSHLEVVNPVLVGVARAHQRVDGAGAAGTRDESAVVPICIHGDAAFPGEGIVPETLNLSRLRGFRTGGTLHIIVNNQVGFTTDPVDARSTHYASDLAKGFEIPIIHVNADDPDAYITATRLGIAYRAEFAKDFLIDLVGYRRHGHNEGDEPTYTQPTLYARVKKHPTPRLVYAQRLIAEGVVTEADVEAMDREVSANLEKIHAELAKGGATDDDEPSGPPAVAPAQIDTAVKRDTLVALNERVVAWPESFHVHPRLAKQLERRRAAAEDPAGIDWGHGEALAFASLLIEGVSIRLTGQDAERGTFSHRHAVLHDVENDSAYVPLAHLPKATGSFEIYNSPLSETAVLGFEYGYSTAAEDTLVLWEAQFGDFVNVAQPIIDQFIAADRAKWKQDSGVVLLLPHGYEGQGPEHSSARLERFLQSCAEGNMRVAYPSTPAQYFHILRRQAKLSPRRPLILMQPKSLLRLPEAGSGLEALATGSFQPVLDDPRASQSREKVRRLVFCTGKIYYDLAAVVAGRNGETRTPVALIRVEELYPWPHSEVGQVIDRYPGVEEVVWVQEEPKNMGAWMYIAPWLRAATGTVLSVTYVGRPERASPAEGYHAWHLAEQKRIVETVLDSPLRSSSLRRRTPVSKA
jgi:2-oxoglutarate dehydrogenase E1 component